MIYFDNAATGGRKPDCVINAVTASLKACANPGRSGHKLSLTCAKLVQNCRKLLTEVFHGYGFDRAVFTKNCTEALNIALLGTLKQGDHVIVSCMEHNSVLRPLEFLQKQGVISYEVCPLDEHGDLDFKALAALVTPQTRLVAISTASNVTGATPNLARLREILPTQTLLLCDGAQGAGHFPIDMQTHDIDFLTLAGHKGLMGIQGSGALLFSERVDPTPILYGGTGSISLSLDMPDFYPDCLEAGTLSFPAIVSLFEGVNYVNARLEEIGTRCLTLTKYLLNGLKRLPNYKPYSKPNPCGIVAFQHAFLQSEQLAEILSARYSIAVRGGLHCAPLMHEALGSLDGGLTRVSFSHFNTENEIDELLCALDKAEKV